jgi:hypothetical protein
MPVLGKCRNTEEAALLGYRQISSSMQILHIPARNQQVTLQTSDFQIKYHEFF